MPIRVLFLITVFFWAAAAGRAQDGVVGTEPAGIASKISSAVSGNSGALAAGLVGLAVSGQALSPGVAESTAEYFTFIGGIAEEAADAASDDDSAHGHGSGHGQ